MRSFSSGVTFKLTGITAVANWVAVAAALSGMSTSHEPDDDGEVPREFLAALPSSWLLFGFAMMATLLSLVETLDVLFDVDAEEAAGAGTSLNRRRVAYRGSGIATAAAAFDDDDDDDLVDSGAGVDDDDSCCCSCFGAEEGVVRERPSVKAVPTGESSANHASRENGDHRRGGGRGFSAACAKVARRVATRANVNTFIRRSVGVVRCVSDSDSGSGGLK